MYLDGSFCALAGDPKAMKTCRAPYTCVVDGLALETTILMKMEEGVIYFWRKDRMCLAFLTLPDCLIVLFSFPLSLKLFL